MKLQRPPRLVRRALLERIANEITEWPTSAHKEAGSAVCDAFTLLTTADDRDVNAGGFMVQELLKLAVRRVADLQPLTDPPGDAPVDTKRLSDCLVGLLESIELARDVATETLSAVVLMEGGAS